MGTAAHRRVSARDEYDAGVKALKGLLPEARENRDRFSFRRDDEVRYRPVAAFRVDDVREELNALEFKKRKLNNAMQRANFDHTITIDGREMNLVEALELRKAANVQLGELNSQLASAAYERIIYKEDRDIVEMPEADYLAT